MKKYLSITVGLMLVIGALPVLAADDVTIDPSVEISVSGYTLVVSGTAKIIDSISVTDSNFLVTLSPGASFSVTSADKRKFSYSGGTGITSGTQCLGYSAISVSASSANTSSADATITPSTTETCDGSTTTTTTTSSSGGGGGGGGSGGGNNPNANMFSQTQTTSSQTTTTTTAALATTQTSSTAAATSAVAGGHVFATPLKLGSVGTEVSELQKVLVAKGYLAMPSGVAHGTFGSLTQSAVKKYQAANGIDQLGNVGPATRASLNASVAAAVSAPVAAVSSASSASIEALQTQLQALQAQLLLLLSQQMELLKAQQ